MNKDLARYLAGLIVSDIDNRRPQGKMNTSSYEAELIEAALINGRFDVLVTYLNNKFNS